MNPSHPPTNVGSYPKRSVKNSEGFEKLIMCSKDGAKLGKLNPIPFKKKIKNHKKSLISEEFSNKIAILEFLVINFGQQTPDNIKKSEKKANPELVKEIYNSFSQMYSLEECEKALLTSDNEIELAAQWLIEEGEEER